MVNVYLVREAVKYNQMVRVTGVSVTDTMRKTMTITSTRSASSVLLELLVGRVLSVCHVRLDTIMTNH